MRVATEDDAVTTTRNTPGLRGDRPKANYLCDNENKGDLPDGTKGLDGLPHASRRCAHAPVVALGLIQVQEGGMGKVAAGSKEGTTGRE